MTSTRAPEEPASGTNGAGLGTFAGVFTPSILTILGIILFLRLGFIVGESGLRRTIGVIAVANAISVLTSLSVAAISTNLRVRGGGDYYLISRTLGLAFGGAIGLVLFLAQSVSVGFYAMGFAEAVAGGPSTGDGVQVQVVAALAVLSLFGLAWMGADWATRFQYAVLAILAAALAVVVVGGVRTWDEAVLAANWTAPAASLGFWSAFAIFFPAVTGFTQGVSMSGDLAKPARSIPRGVLSAVGVSIVIYLGCAVILAAVVPGPVLREDYLALKRVAAVGPLVNAGVVAATLSSALASFLGAPRILQSLARDEVFPILRRFASGSGPKDNPRAAVVLAGGIALAVIGAGDLNQVAGVVSMFFLISYGLLNYATYFEARIESPAFRPTFRVYHPAVGLAGAVACGAAMLAIDLTTGLVAAAVVFGIYQYLEYRAVPARWADVRRSHHLYEARQHLLAAAADPEHPRDWRPQLLVFTDQPERRRRLLRFASWIEGGGGLTTVVRIIEGEGPGMIRRREEAMEALGKEIAEGSFKAFPLVVTGPSLDDIISTVVQAAGIGPLQANTVVVNWVADAPGMPFALGSRRFGRNLQTAFRLGCNLLVLDATSEEWERLDDTPGERRRIDLWWRRTRSGDLMLLLAHLITRSEAWKGATIRVLADERQDESGAELGERLREALIEYRIDAEVVVCRGAAEDIVRRSADASLVLLPFILRGTRFEGVVGEVGRLLPRLPAVAMVTAAQDVDLSGDPEQERGAEAETEGDQGAGG